MVLAVLVVLVVVVQGVALLVPELLAKVTLVVLEARLFMQEVVVVHLVLVQ
jgi:hypothetical protein